MSALAQRLSQVQVKKAVGCWLLAILDLAFCSSAGLMQAFQGPAGLLFALRNRERTNQVTVDCRNGNECKNVRTDV